MRTLLAFLAIISWTFGVSAAPVKSTYGVTNMVSTDWNCSDNRGGLICPLNGGSGKTGPSGAESTGPGPSAGLGGQNGKH